MDKNSSYFIRMPWGENSIQDFLTDSFGVIFLIIFGISMMIVQTSVVSIPIAALGVDIDYELFVTTAERFRHNSCDSIRCLTDMLESCSLWWPLVGCIVSRLLSTTILSLLVLANPKREMEFTVYANRVISCLDFLLQTLSTCLFGFIWTASSLTRDAHAGIKKEFEFRLVESWDWALILVVFALFATLYSYRLLVKRLQEGDDFFNLSGFKMIEVTATIFSLSIFWIVVSYVFGKFTSLLGIWKETNDKYFIEFGDGNVFYGFAVLCFACAIILIWGFHLASEHVK